jgi:hypothetical protein
LSLFHLVILDNLFLFNPLAAGVVNTRQLPISQPTYCSETMKPSGDVSLKNAFIDVGLFFENRQEARKLGLLPRGKSFEAGCERLEPQERKARVFKGQSDIDDFNCIIRVRSSDGRLFS